ncbi:MAG: hypothetical protein EZS28_043227 [Streblomastix strix]|uniref:Uncharacterized protein n=1 Tax=Streblomastix strix TaxID=222440 RepID=A0A5J4TSD6_9EUKA|nr:MAG: hypothetical protein EZS28_043227 [Streblomastix strix]
MEHGKEILDKQQEGDRSHVLRSIQLRISLQRAANQSDPHQVRQLYRNIRFSKTKGGPQIQHIPGLSNIKTDSLSRLSTQSDHSAKRRYVQAFAKRG